ncbi:hypothetical protein AVEN_58732-1 [Araneus ventricosus]|uniref:YqaJ viral recombinase domain-containing protein n=1 Tax=Araneus ventricosus TaxID=182803 RepID=A0A4Y2G1J5_ARAVE|nr:hypothetical protein AVEN_58732-1 [Araneus ventricosus]
MGRYGKSGRLNLSARRYKKGGNLPNRKKSKIDTVHMKYGLLHESDVVKYISNELKIEVNSCGFFVKKEEPYLGATPDGLIGDDGILEIKCPSSCAKFTPEEAINEKKVLVF